MNQGMLMESMNLAAAWKLPVVFICKDDRWSITTQSKAVTGGDLNERIHGLGLQVVDVDGLDVTKVWEAAEGVIEHTRSGFGPALLHARCVHFEGHFLGLQLIRLVRHPLRELPGIAIPLTRSFLQSGGAIFRERLAGMNIIFSSVMETLRDPRRDPVYDPIWRTRKSLQPEADHLQVLEEQVEKELLNIFASALQEVPA
jgi:hypothetical protein